MSHHIYQTEAVLLGSHNVSESNKLFLLFTKDFGFVPAVAQGIRHLKSKLRYSLQDFGYTRIDLVRGKDIWRITNAENINGYHKLLQDKNNTVFIARIFSLLRRLLHGEEKNQELFEVLAQTLRFLDQEELSQEDLSNLEILTNLKILHHLGYGVEKEIYRTLIIMPPSRELLSCVSPIKRECLTDINSALKETHL